MIERIKQVVSQFLSSLFIGRYGTITSYNPVNYTVKVKIQPEGTTTGFIPLTAPWVGNNLGAVFGPNEGDQVLVHFIDGNLQAALVGGRTFNNDAQPPVVQSGQAAIVDSQGAYVRLNNDGTMTFGAPTSITWTAPNNYVMGNLTVSQATVLQQTLAVTGAQTNSSTITATGTISSSTDVVAAGKSGKSHEHTVGSSTTSPPI
jgi:phage baseplate assembly protein V